MTEFLLIYRNAPPIATEAPTTEQLKDISKPWIDWMGSIAAQNKLANVGARLTFDGTTLRESAITDGPYAEIKEIILGYSVVKTETKAEAIELAKGCPILADGGSVEVRDVVPMGN
jgi:hypothetical protein